MSLGVFGFGCEDALVHLLNFVWPNIFETSPHVIQAVMDSIEGLRVGLGANKMLQYALQVRFPSSPLITCMFRDYFNMVFPQILFLHNSNSPKFYNFCFLFFSQMYKFVLFCVLNTEGSILDITGKSPIGNFCLIGWMILTPV